jgi:hypothetical protein
MSRFMIKKNEYILWSLFFFRDFGWSLW